MLFCFILPQLSSLFEGILEIYCVHPSNLDFLLFTSSIFAFLSTIDYSVTSPCVCFLFLRTIDYLIVLFTLSFCTSNYLHSVIFILPSVSSCVGGHFIIFHFIQFVAFTSVELLSQLLSVPRGFINVMCVTQIFVSVIIIVIKVLCIQLQNFPFVKY